jgi:predicted metal-dependent phosphoesterase TrpH
MDPERLIARATDIGLDGVCVTEHEEIGGAEIAQELGRKCGLPVFRGIEIYTEFGDMLVYGLYRDAPGWKTPFDELVEMCREVGAAIVPAHPCRVVGELERLHGADRVEYMLERVTAVETHNGGCTPNGNRAAEILARDHSLPGLGGSDAHHEFQVARCLTAFEGPIASDEELVSALRSGLYRGAYGSEFLEYGIAAQPLDIPSPTDEKGPP